MKFSKASAATIAVIIVVVLLIIAGGVWYYIANKPIACTEEAKLCPDGTSVGRTEPNCEFAACPVASGCKNLYWYDNVHTTCQEPKQFCGAYMYQYLQTFETKAECENSLATKDWKTYTNEKYWFSFKYPADWSNNDINNTSPFLSLGESIMNQKNIVGGIITIDLACIFATGFEFSETITEKSKVKYGSNSFDEEKVYIVSNGNKELALDMLFLKFPDSYKNKLYNNDPECDVAGFIIRNSDYQQNIAQILSTFKFIP